MIRLLVGIAVVALVVVLSAVLTALVKADGIVPIFALFGGISFFLGPEFTGAGFFAKGMYVDTATPGCVWRCLGIIIWVIGGIICIITSELI